MYLYNDHLTGEKLGTRYIRIKIIFYIIFVLAMGFLGTFRYDFNMFILILF